MNTKEFNKILDRLGHFGFFQAFVFVLICIIQIFVGIHMLANVFLLAEPKHRCFIPFCDDNSTKFHESFISFTIPNASDGSGYSGCEHYAVVPGQRSCFPDSFETNLTEPCTQYVWDTSEFESTVVSEFQLVCKRSWSAAISSSVFMGGVLFGSAAFGMIADRFGRKKVMMSATVIMLVSATTTSFAPHINVFTFTRFITAAAVSGLFQTGYILAIEYVGNSKRLICANIMQIVFALGELGLSLVAYFVRNWRPLELVISAPAAFLLAYYWLLPESARWLFSKGRYDDAEKTLLQAAQWNKVSMPNHLLKTTRHSSVDSEVQVLTTPTVGPWSLVKTRRMRKWSLNIFFNWVVNAMVYYGLSLNTGNLSGNAYVNFAILAAVEIPAVLLSTVFLHYCGRRYVLCFVMVFGGLSCGATIFVPNDLSWLITVFAVLGKSAIAASFAIIYVYSAEIYPTVLRSTGIGFSSMFARFGGIVAPIINELETIYEPLPMIVFGSASILSGLLALALPETHNKQLPESIEEAEGLATESPSAVKIDHRKSLPYMGSTSPRVTRRNFDDTRKLLSSDEE